MITRIEALNYRCLRYVSQDLGPFQILVGPNASGKSTFLDVVALMRDLIRDGLERAITARAPNYTDLFWNRTGTEFQLAVEARIPEARRQPRAKSGWEVCRYEIGIGHTGDTHELGITSEILRLGHAKPVKAVQRRLFPAPPEPVSDIVMKTRVPGWKTIVNKVLAGNDNFYSETGGWDHAFKLGPRKSALANLPDDESKFPVATWFKRLLMVGVEKLVLNSEAMRRPCSPNAPRTFLPDGSNLPWVVHDLQAKDHQRLDDWVRHLRTVLPDIEGVDTVEQPNDRHRYLVVRYRNGLGVPSWLVSDGTLRLLALTLPAYIPDMRGVYLIEEPENGIHPTAVEAVFQSLTSVYDGQVLLATHSPVILSVAEVEHVLCFGKSHAGAVDIVRGDKHPKLAHWRGETNLGMLFASGVLG